jgi:hypothetical protein
VEHLPALLRRERLLRAAAQKPPDAGRDQCSEPWVVLGLESSESPTERLASQQRASPLPELLPVLS